jgi:hypothetical protein
MRNLAVKLALFALSTLLLAATAQAAPAEEIELVRPDGVVQIEPINVLPHPKSLDGKTIVLKWTTKPNGNIMLDRVAELIAKEYPTAKVVKTYSEKDMVPGAREKTLLSGWSTSKPRSVQMAKAMLSEVKPDLVIGGQGA